ncbi:MAG: NADH:ubiquinone reductase (Na(+)-transporting) subunit C [Bacteroidota bacterium]
MSSKGNSGTIVFALVVTTLSAALLAAAATILKPAQDENVLKEKQQNILSLVGLNGPNDYKKFDQLVQGLVIDQEGQQVQGVEALALDLALEKKLNTKNPAYKVRYPMYVYRDPRGRTTYLLQVAGIGLWGPIWGYLALDEDGNTLRSAIFDHKGETPGLGAEINTDAFEQQFINKKLLNEQGDFVSVKVEKGKHDASMPHAVDAISGVTITSNGVSKMLEQDLACYLKYIRQQSTQSPQL